MRVGGHLACCEKSSLEMTMMESKYEENDEGGKGERQEEKSEGQIMSDGEEETIL